MSYRRSSNQPDGWLGEKPTRDMPTIYNLRQDPFERYPMVNGETPATGAFGYGNDFFAREFWRFVSAPSSVWQRRGVPKSHRLVPAGGGEPVAVGAERHGG